GSRSSAHPFAPVTSVSIACAPPVGNDISRNPGGGASGRGAGRPDLAADAAVRGRPPPAPATPKNAPPCKAPPSILAAGEDKGGRRVCRRTDPNQTRKEGETAMHVKTNVKSGAMNHNETLVRDAGKGPRAKAPALKVKTSVKSGAMNHNETLVRSGKKGKV